MTGSGLEVADRVHNELGCPFEVEGAIDENAAQAAASGRKKHGRFIAGDGRISQGFEQCDSDLSGLAGQAVVAEGVIPSTERWYFVGHLRFPQ